jgi:hypothetical protein
MIIALDLKFIHSAARPAAAVLCADARANSHVACSPNDDNEEIDEHKLQTVKQNPYIYELRHGSHCVAKTHQRSSLASNHYHMGSTAWVTAASTYPLSLPMPADKIRIVAHMRIFQCTSRARFSKRTYDTYPDRACDNKARGRCSQPTSLNAALTD